MQVIFAATLLLSAALMFIVEPMFAKMVLPLLGGSPSVWNTCLVFYQAALMAGYIYAHLSLKWLGPRRQAVLHVALLCLPWIALPIGVAHGWTPPSESNPIPWLLLLLTVCVGLPFFCVSASAPVLQAWFAHCGGPRPKTRTSSTPPATSAAWRDWRPIRYWSNRGCRWPCRHDVGPPVTGCSWCWSRCAPLRYSVSLSLAGDGRGEGEFAGYVAV